MVEYTVTPTSPLGCVGTPFIVDVTIGAAPATPVITGPNTICGLTTATYSVAAIPEATNYNWTITTGGSAMTIASGQGTTSINVNISSNNINLFVVSVVASNDCGNSGTTTLNITKKPRVPGAITGPTSTCGQNTATYSIAPVFSATSYLWTLPAGMNVVSGTGTTSITVSIASSFVVGLVKVAAVNACGYVPGVSLSVTGNVTIAPVAIFGTANVCGVTSGTYSVAAVFGATGYQWTATGTGMSISGPSTGLSVTVLTDGVHGGTLSCAGTNVCGTGSPRTRALSVAAIQPGVIAGPTNTCGMTTATYSVASVGTGYIYNWSLAMAGWSITSGQGTTSITVTGPATGTSASGLLKVTSTNSCGNTSLYRTMAVTYCHNSIAMDNAGESGSTFSNIYPNPTSSEFTIDVTIDKQQSSIYNQQLIMEIYDVLGNLVVHQKHEVVNGTNILKTNIEQFNNGIYFVRLIDVDGNVIYTERMMKQ